MDLVTEFLFSDRFQGFARKSLSSVGLTDPDSLGQLTELLADYARSHGFFGDDRPPHWQALLISRARHAGRDFCRTRSRRRVLVPAASAHQDGAECDPQQLAAPTTRSAPEIANSSEICDATRAAIQELPEKQRFAVLQTAVGATPAEIARSLGVNPQAARASLRRGRKHLLQILLARNLLTPQLRAAALRATGRRGKPDSPPDSGNQLGAAGAKAILQPRLPTMGDRFSGIVVPRLEPELP